MQICYCPSPKKVGDDWVCVDKQDLGAGQCLPRKQGMSKMADNAAEAVDRLCVCKDEKCATRWIAEHNLISSMVIGFSIACGEAANNPEFVDVDCDQWVKLGTKAMECLGPFESAQREIIDATFVRAD